MYLSNKWILLSLCFLLHFVAAAQPVVEIKPAKDTLSQEDSFEKQYQINIIKTHINGILIPRDLYDSFAQLKLLMDRPTLLQFQNLPEERAAKKVYLVMWIAQNWNFREGSRLSDLIRKLGITYPEHMAHFIVVTFHRHLNNKDLGIKERVTFYKEKEREAYEKEKDGKKKEVIFEETRTRKQ